MAPGVLVPLVGFGVQTGQSSSMASVSLLRVVESVAEGWLGSCPGCGGGYGQCGYGGVLWEMAAQGAVPSLEEADKGHGPPELPSWRVQAPQVFNQSEGLLELTIISSKPEGLACP